MPHLVHAIGHVKINTRVTESAGAMIECSGSMALVADDANFVPNVITNLERPGNVRCMNVWGTPAPLEWRQHHFPFTAIN